MSVSSPDNQVIYTGSGTTGPFDFDFKIFVSSELLVQKYTIATETVVDLTETTDYDVTIDQDGTGHIDTVVAVTSAYKLIITRTLPLTQEISYVENDKFPSASHEEGLDRGVMIAQQLQEQIDRCVKVIPGSTSVPSLSDITAAVNDAEAAQAAAEVAQGLAEDAKDDAVAAKNAAEAAAGTFTPASQAEAEAGTENTHYMTALRTAQAIAALAAGKPTELSFTSGDLASSILTITGDKTVVSLRNNTDQEYMPTDIYLSGGNTKIDLTGLTITGTHKVRYFDA